MYHQIPCRLGIYSTRIVAVLEIGIGLGIPGYGKSAVNEPEAVTDRLITQVPDAEPSAGQLPAFGFACLSQVYAVIVPAESHPHAREEVTFSALVCWPLL